MPPSHQLVVFSLDEQRYALHLPAVQRVVRMIEITPLPKAPEIVLGVINVQGRIVPVVDIRRRFRLPVRDLRLSDHLLIAHAAKRTVALVVDAVSSTVEHSAQAVIMAEEILPGLAYVAGVIRLEDGLVLIHDLDTLLSLEEEHTLDDAMP
jgi:purine-binding chemotaxis protein CheW